VSRQWRVSRNPERSTFTQDLQWRLDHQLGKTGKLFTTQSPQKNVVCPLFPLAVVLYIVIPVILAQVWRRTLLQRGQAKYNATLVTLGHLSILALLATLVLLFAFQGEAIIEQPVIIVLLAVPILIQVFFNSGLAYWLNRKVGEQHSVACPSALIGASNFFELAVAAAISLFGFESGAALATVVGVLIEVPVMLLVVKFVNRSKGWYEAGLSAP
jgi:ACR3 family arsenite transporter